MYVFTKYGYFKPLTDKESKTFLDIIIKIVNKSNCKSNKLQDDQGRKFQNELVKNDQMVMII